MSVDVTITKTAWDALDAKLSFSSVGYNPTCFIEESFIGIKLKQNEKIVYTNSTTLYTSLLQMMAQALSVQHDDSHDISASDASDAFCNTTINKEEEEQIYPFFKIKRQTPLINAGYATRVAIITNTIQRFIMSHHQQQQTTTPTGLNVVILGCGFDVLGLWIHSLQTQVSGMKIYTYEVDTYDIAMKKRYALQFIASSYHSSSLSNTHAHLQDFYLYPVQNRDTPSNNRILFQGYISISSKDDHDSSSSSSKNYTLFHADLRNLSSLHQGLQDSNLDVSLPTLVLSELVLAYLGTQDTIQELFNYISMNLCVNQDSMLLCYEPMGSRTIQQQSEDVPTISVLDGYTIDYFQHFLDKLDRNSMSMKQIPQQDEEQYQRFHCIGPDPTSICNRLRACGFDGPVDCCNASKAAASIGWKLNSHDIFDEYTALLMHLSCYAVITACPSSQIKMTMFRQICPWTRTHRALYGSGFQRIQYYSTKTNNVSTKYPEFSISIISAQDEEQVRTLFENTYAQWFDTYPSIRKLVKSSLKSDLSLTDADIRDSSIIPPKRFCKIRDYYNSLDGAFWIATVNRLHVDHRYEDNKNKRKVIGFMGICRAGITSTSLQRYEILRLVVCKDWRNLGVGKALVSNAEEFIRRRLDPDSQGTAIVTATTPAISEAANKFYLSLGFELDHEVTQSNLLMKTYHWSVKSGKCHE